MQKQQPSSNWKIFFFCFLPNIVNYHATSNRNMLPVEMHILSRAITIHLGCIAWEATQERNKRKLLHLIGFQQTILVKSSILNSCYRRNGLKFFIVRSVSEFLLEKFDHACRCKTETIPGGVNVLEVVCERVSLMVKVNGNRFERSPI